MTEIRPIQESEADEFLDLLCGVFGLDHGRARGIFYTEPLFDLKRKWALFEGREMVSILTTSPLLFGWGRAYGIAGVATKSDRRGEGLASKLLERVSQESARIGECGALLFARDLSLYQRNGFAPLDRVVRAPFALAPEGKLPASYDHDQVRVLYDRWAEQHPDRLRRDDQRWRYWGWHYRVCSPFQSGYLCAEPGVLREAIYGPKVSALPLPSGTEWFGTTFMADQLEIPLAGEPKLDLYLMGRGIPGMPQMFMTDQF